MRLVHLTDPHLAAPPHWRSLSGRSHHGKRYLGYLSWMRKRRHHLRPDWLAEALADARRHAPDHWVVSGDLAQIGTEEEIRAGRAWLESLAPAEQITFVPGNHDVYAPDSVTAIRREWSAWLPTDGQEGYPRLHRQGDVALFGLSTALPTPPLSATGLLGSAQLDRLATELARHRDAFRVLVLHHPPLPGMIRHRKRLRDAGALEALLKAEPVQLILHGHSHWNRSSERLGAHVFCTAPASAEAASYRAFDIERTDGGWSVGSALIQRRDAEFATVESSCWSVTAPG